MNTQPSISWDAKLASQRVLGLEDGEDPQVADLLRRLPARNYVASTEEIDAMQLLVNPEALSTRSGVITTADQRGRRVRMEAVINEFATSFFDLPEDQRRQQWQELVDGCDDLPDLSHWLRELGTGLDLGEVPSSSDERTAYLISKCCGVFVARGIERARRRQEMIALYCADSAAWEPALRELQSHRRFVDQVASWVNGLPNAAFSELMRGAPLEPIRVSYRPPEPATADSRANWGWMYVAVIVFLIRVCLQAPSSNSRTDRPFWPPAESKRDPNQNWTVEDQRRLLDTIRDVQAKRLERDSTTESPATTTEFTDLAPLKVTDEEQQRLDELLKSQNDRNLRGPKPPQKPISPANDSTEANGPQDTKAEHE